jgi:hypothetical protein
MNLKWYQMMVSSIITVLKTFLLSKVNEEFKKGGQRVKKGKQKKKGKKKDTYHTPILFFTIANIKHCSLKLLLIIIKKSVLV